MVGRAGGRPPYATACLIYGLAEHPIYGPYIRGRLALAGLDLSTNAAVWLDAVYAVALDMPEGDRLDKMAQELIRKSAMLRPEEFRETWGRRPEQVALAGRLGRGAGVESGRGTGAAPDPEAVRAKWDQLQRRKTGGGG